MEQLKGKTALVTGGSKGIGKALALALAAEGVNVGITGRNEQALEAVAKEIAATGVKAAWASADVKDYAGVEAAVQKITGQLGPIDILINNAGIAAFGAFADMPVSQWEEIIRVNVLGMYYVTKAVIPAMIERQSGDVINISSTAGLRGAANTSAYSASKFAVLGMTESLMMEVRKHNIRVSALTPSTVATDMSVSDLKITDGNPDKVLQPDDIAELLIAHLKLKSRALIKSVSIWSTNP
ncbi:3-ketoacyl-ACP reductase [Chitinophaga lutea]